MRDSAMWNERRLPYHIPVWTETDFDSHVLSAARSLAELDEKQVNAVATRIELDLRIGYAFTRFITNNLRPLGGPMEKLTLSYGMRPTINMLNPLLTAQDRASSQPLASSWTVTFESRTLSRSPSGASKSCITGRGRRLSSLGCATDFLIECQQ